MPERLLCTLGPETLGSRAEEAKGAQNTKAWDPGSGQSHIENYYDSGEYLSVREHVARTDNYNSASVPGTRYQVPPEHLSGKPEHMFGVFERLFVFREHCSGSALVGVHRPLLPLV